MDQTSFISLFEPSKTGRTDLSGKPLPGQAAAAHGGSDDLMLRHLLAPAAIAPPGQTADSGARAASTLIGSSANHACATGQWVALPDWRDPGVGGARHDGHAAPQPASPSLAGR